VVDFLKEGSLLITIQGFPFHPMKKRLLTDHEEGDQFRFLRRRRAQRDLMRERSHPLPLLLRLNLNNVLHHSIASKLFSWSRRRKGQLDDESELVIQ
jgi:hypothetical protein